MFNPNRVRTSVNAKASLLPAPLTTIKQILAHQFVGNHHSDSDAFRQIHRFVDNPANPIDQRAKALRHIAHAGMGLHGEDACDHLDDAALVLGYL